MGDGDVRHRLSNLIFLLIISLTIFMPGFNEAARSQNTPTWETGQRDLLGEALDTVGWTRVDLGYEPDGYWSRYPRVPYKLPIFDSLFREPFRVYDYMKSFGNTVARFLDPELEAEIRYDGYPSPNRIHLMMLTLAVEPRVDGFRAYSTNLLPRADEEEPILDAMRRLYVADGDQLLRSSFGSEPAWPNPESEIITQLEGVDIELEKIFAELILNALDAVQWRNEGVRRIPMEMMVDVFAMRDFAQTQGDGIVYYPQVDDAAQLIDEQAMAYAAMKAGQAVEDCRYALENYISENPGAKDFTFETGSPFGRILIAGDGRDTHSYDDYFILIDLGGDDIYTGGVGATISPVHGVSLCLDLDGDDKYISESQSHGSQGSGIFGVGVLYDAYGNDKYEAVDMAQGSGLLGTGILYDGDGADEYRMEVSGQGSGSFGHGLCLDSGEGDDYYYMHGEGQGYGGCNGIGILANWSGDDHYYAEPYVKNVNRADYHSNFVLNVSNCQGVGSGRRGDGTDGHSWAGGLGFIADVHGNDTYEAGNFSQGVGYWFGIGMMYDKDGNDVYYSPVYTQGTAVHYAIGMLLDESGDDRHDTWDHSTSAISFARDWAISFLIDIEGDDYYRAYNTSMCYTNIRSNSFFFDLAGDDHYVVGERQRMLGSCDFYHYDEYWNGSFIHYCNSISLFIDARGEDLYESWVREDTGEVDKWGVPIFDDIYTVSERYGNDMRWENPSPNGDRYGYNNYGIGWDVEGGENATIPDVVWRDPAPEEEEEEE